MMMTNKYKVIIHHPEIQNKRGDDVIGLLQSAWDEECEIEFILNEPITKVSNNDCQIDWTKHITTTCGENTNNRVKATIKIPLNYNKEN